MDISCGKQISVALAPKRLRKMIRERSLTKNVSLSQFGGVTVSASPKDSNSLLFQSKSYSIGPQSLNIQIRRRENERIERENQAFAKKLFDNTGFISKKKHDEEFYMHSLYRNKLTKVRNNSTLRS